MLTNKEQRDLESLIDLRGLEHVLDCIGLICHEKSEHIEASYGDKMLAREWRDSGNQISSLGARVAV